MAFKKRRYQKAKRVCLEYLSTGASTPADYMRIYKKMIYQENYEACKAIAEVLKPLNYFVEDTHEHIPHIKNA